MKISVVVPTLYREECLVQTLKDLYNQNAKDFEIIVVDQSDDPCKEAVECIEKEGNVPTRYYHTTQFRALPTARNFGAQMAEFDNYLFIDDDVRMPEDFIEKHRLLPDNPRIGVIAGGITEDKDPPANDEKVGAYSSWWGVGSRYYNSTQSKYVAHAPGGNRLSAARSYQTRLSAGS